MGNQLYDENKRLKARVEHLEERLREKANRDALPNMLEGCLFAFMQGRAAFKVEVCGQPTYEIRFNCDPPPAPPRQPSDASHLTP